MDSPTGDAEAAPAEPRWGLGDAVAGWVLGTLAAVVIISIVARNGSVTLLGLAVGQVGLWAGLLGAVIRASYLKGRRSLAVDFGLEVRATDIGRGVVVGLVSQLVLVPVIYLPFRLFSGNPDVSKPARDLADQAHGATFIGFALVVILGAPVIEELFFRGLVLRAFQRRFGTRWAVFGSAVAFGAAHLELLQFPALVALGVLLAWLAIRTKRLGPGIFAHAVFNALAVASLYARR